MTSSRFLLSNGVVLPPSDTPELTTFLESRPGAYTTTRTHSNASCVLFWERHMQRLANSARILYNSNPHFLFKNVVCRLPDLSNSSIWESMIRSLVDGAMGKVLPVALNGRSGDEELAITTAVQGNSEKLRGVESGEEESVSRMFDVHVHVGGYVPPVFGVRGGGARLAVVGRGRDVAAAKYTDWVRLRKPLEKLRAPTVTELLLSNDGDHILEGSVTNFFVVCHRDKYGAEGNYTNYLESTCPFEVQTAPVSDGVLPGVIRQLITEICFEKGIPFREVAPSWSEHDSWAEAFITNSLRVMQHVENIQIPSSVESLESKTWNEIAWQEKQFEEGPGKITTLIQKELVYKASLDGYPVTSYWKAK